MDPRESRRFHDSNTSHVILYLGLSSMYPSRFSIQIHLMLFFIISPGTHTPPMSVIQIHLMLFFIFKSTYLHLVDVPIQIHLMLFFINFFLCFFYIFVCIQIHLMLFFILIQQYHVGLVLNSNTSHVILYPTHFRLFLHYYTSSLLIFQYFIIFYQPYLFSCQILCFFLIFPVFSGFCLTFPCSSPGKIIESRTPLYQYLRFPGFLLQTHCHSSAL